MSSHDPTDRRLRIAGILILLGLVIQAAALRWVHPAAFLVLAFIGIPLASLGIVIYLWALVSIRSDTAGAPPVP
jgi:hypothetical protein